MRLTLFLASLLCVGLLIYAPIDTFRLQEYHRHQKAYRSAKIELATTDAQRKEARQYPIKIRQIVLPDLNRIDRCTSCHVGLEDPAMKDAENPIKTHPGNYLANHDIQKVGCTVCHDGQGRALTAADAHATGLSTWEKPILYPPVIQANCLRCHEVSELPGLEIIQKGSELFNSRGCMGCHKLEGRGGQLGPDLTNIADANTELKRAEGHLEGEASLLLHGNKNLAYIYESIKTPGAQPSTTAMIDFKFSDDEVLALTVFLKGLSKRDLPASYVMKRRNRFYRNKRLNGKNLFAKYCVACHGQGGKGGVENKNYGKGTVPPLNTLAEKMFIEYPEDAEYLAKLLAENVDIENMDEPLDVEGRARVLAQYRAIKDVIQKGSIAGKAKEGGPPALLNMPSWKADGLDDAEINSILSYLLLQYPWEEDSEYEEDGVDDQEDDEDEGVDTDETEDDGTEEQDK